MNDSNKWNFDHQPTPEEEEFSFSSFIPLWILLGVVVLAVLCWFGCEAEARGNCSSFCKRVPFDRSPRRAQGTGINDRLNAVGVPNDSILRANAEMEALLNRNNVSPVPNSYTPVRLSATAPPVSPRTTPDPSASPPSYQHLIATDQRVREQGVITRLQNRGYCNTARVLAGIFRDMTTPQVSSQTSESLSSSAVGTLELPHTQQSTETTVRGDFRSDRAQRSWRSYFNTADRLRELTSNSRTQSVENGTDVTPTRHQPRPQTPPPMYHEVEQTEVGVRRADSLPSYDDFMAMPHKYTT